MRRTETACGQKIPVLEWNVRDRPCVVYKVKEKVLGLRCHFSLLTDIMSTSSATINTVFYHVINYEVSFLSTGISSFE